jgi:hypothetical protein
VLDLVNPAGTVGRPFGRRGQARLDKAAQITSTHTRNMRA